MKHLTLDIPEKHSLAELPARCESAWLSMLPHTKRALDQIEANYPRGSIQCHQCGERRELLKDRTVAVTAKEGSVAARYDPCMKCFPWISYQARSENIGAPPMQPVCRVKRDQAGNIMSRWLESPSVSLKLPRLYLTGNTRKAIHFLIMTSPNGWLLKQSVIETCVTMGASFLLGQIEQHPHTLAVVVDTHRGEHLARVFARNSERRTWIIDEDGAASRLLPEDFFTIQL